VTKKGRWADHSELLAQRSRFGVIKATALETLEMSSRTIYARCRPGGPWQRLLPGIILLHNGKPTSDQRVTAALLHAGPDTLLTGIEACRRHGLRPNQLPDSDDLHVLVPHDRKMLSTGFVTVERTVHLPQPVLRDGFPLAPLVRCTTDAARRINAVEPVGSLLVEAIQRGRCHPAALARELDAGSTRGTALPRRLLTEWVNVKSVAEARALTLSRKLPVQPTHWNIDVRGPDGRYVGCPDAWWDDVALAWEIDSVDFHFSRDGYARTLARNTRYAAAGITLVQTLPSRLERDPVGVMSELQAAYATASSRSRPPVTVVLDAAA
jgi:hypothetical protein